MTMMLLNEPNETNEIEAKVKLSIPIATLINRMKTNPQEFWSDNPKWRFIYSGNVKELLSESEKGALHAALMEVRKQEFQHMVMQTILDIDKENEEVEKAKKKLSIKSTRYTGI